MKKIKITEKPWWIVEEENQKDKQERKENKERADYLLRKEEYDKIIAQGKELIHYNSLYHL